jgi:hypothetical protein
MVKILKCSCQHKGQDDLHGVGMRIFNQLASTAKMKESFRCTVCGIVKEDKQ